DRRRAPGGRARPHGVELQEGSVRLGPRSYRPGAVGHETRPAGRSTSPDRRTRVTAMIHVVVKRVVLTVVLLGMAQARPGGAHTLDGTLKKVKDSGTLTLGYRESSPPFSFLGPDKRPIGYSIDLCMHVASEIEKRAGVTGLKLNWVPVTPEGR